MKLSEQRIKEIDNLVKFFEHSDMTTEEFHSKVSKEEYKAFQLYNKEKLKK